ncbi:sigma-70 family RNA polymerase sigma factor [Hyphomonas sp.]|uniref:sigma-70 family RNA polymerase sigma factor n=1 Tax=Hyphomonas sp. TaxID=87 RepID=UPI003527D265
MSPACQDELPDSGNEWSFVDELERLIPELRAFARSLCRERELADDLVQDTCLKAWQAIDSFEPGAPMRPWLFRILRNEFYQYARRSWRSAPLEQEVAENTLVAPADLDARIDFKVLQAAISNLPDVQREALILVVAAGYTYEEAGEICNCSPGTIKSRVSRAREAVVFKMQQADVGQVGGSTRDGSRTANGHIDLISDIESLARGLFSAA